jgi:hypothetical protein
MRHAFRSSPRAVLVLLLFLAACSGRCRGCPPERQEVSKEAGSQSETAVNVSNTGGQQIIMVTYNDGSKDQHIQYAATKRTVLAGASLMGFSYSTDGGSSWTYGGKVKPLDDWPILWGDPAATSPFNHQNFVFISNLAVPKAKYPQGGVVSQGGSNGFYAAIGGACIARSTDGGRTFKVFQCVTNQSHFYDGGSMAASPNGRVWAAYVDVNLDQIDVWQSLRLGTPFSLLPNPFPGKLMVTHPRLRFDAGTGFLYVAARGADGSVYLNRFNGLSWQLPKAATFSTEIYPTIQMSDRRLRAGPQFAFDVGAASQFERGDDTIVAEDNVRILYTRRDPQTGRLYIAGSFCRLDLSACFDAPEWATGTEGSLWHRGDTFNPNVRAFPGFIGISPAWRANYTTRDPDPAGNEVSLQQGSLAMLPNGARVFLSFPLTDPQVVCSDTRGYWGDYDDLQLAGVTEALVPRFVRAFTDSFDGCPERTTYEAREVHTGAAVSPE